MIALSKKTSLKACSSYFSKNKSFNRYFDGKVEMGHPIHKL